MIKRGRTETKRDPAPVATMDSAAEEHSRFLRPASAGLIVRDPITKAALSEAGAMKPWIGPAGRYWRRRLACGDVVAGPTPVVIEEEIVSGSGGSPGAEED